MRPTSTQHIHQSSSMRLSLLLGTLLAMSCSRSEDSNLAIEGTGGLGLQLKLSPTVTISSIEYQLAHDGGFVRSGSFVPAAASDVFSGFVGGLQPDAGYRMSLDSNATIASTAATTHCSGTASFGIVRGETTTVAVRMRCAGVSDDRAASTPDGNTCATISTLRAQPAAAAVGQPIVVEGEAIDPDQRPAPLTFRWSSATGAFSTAVQPATTFTCTKLGPALLSLVVSDGDANCPFEQSTLQVSCADPSQPPGAAGSGNAGASGVGTLAGRGSNAAAAAGRSAANAGVGALSDAAGAAGQTATQSPPWRPTPPQAGRGASQGQNADPASGSQAGADAAAGGQSAPMLPKETEPGQPPSSPGDGDDGPAEPPPADPEDDDRHRDDDRGDEPWPRGDGGRGGDQPPPPSEPAPPPPSEPAPPPPSEPAPPPPSEPELPPSDEPEPTPPSEPQPTPPSEPEPSAPHQLDASVPGAPEPPTPNPEPPTPAEPESPAQPDASAPNPPEPPLPDEPEAPAPDHPDASLPQRAARSAPLWRQP